MIGHSTVKTCHNRAALYDEGDWVILLLVVASAAKRFVCIALELPALNSPRQSLLLGIVITGLTVALSWTFTHVVFTLHYANVYYRPDDDGPRRTDVSRRPRADYRDFLYYSFVIGCAAQTGDVDTVSPAMRHLTLVHGIVAFAFNTAILALTINVGDQPASLRRPCRSAAVRRSRRAGPVRGAVPRRRRARRLGGRDQRRQTCVLPAWSSRPSIRPTRSSVRCGPCSTS